MIPPILSFQEAKCAHRRTIVQRHYHWTQNCKYTSLQHHYHWMPNKPLARIMDAKYAYLQLSLDMPNTPLATKYFSYKKGLRWTYANNLSSLLVRSSLRPPPANQFRNSLSPSTHQNMADKTTRIYNETEDTMVFVTKDQYNATRKIKKIGAGKHIDLSYRDGMVSSNPLIDIFYEIYPADRDDGWSLRENVLPIQVFDHSKIKISYNIESGKVVLAYETGGFIQRLRMVRWMKDLFSG